MGRLLLKRRDYAHNMLLPYIDKTEDLLRKAIRQNDRYGECSISAAVDLGFPHDVIRIAGGFPTGCLVEWQSNLSFVPIDTTVNIDTSTICELDDDITDKISNKTFDKLKESLEKSSYLFNFHKGNHFISFGRKRSNNKPVLVIHSNEKEFKYQYNGLMPTKDNWFSNEIRTVCDGERYLRYITGSTAELFVDIAKSLEDFNVVRHKFVAHLVTNGLANVVNQIDHHHYYMPTRNSVAIGCFPASLDTDVPIFSRPGRPITIFRPKAGGTNKLSSSSFADKVLVPHGWGKTCVEGLEFVNDLQLNLFYMGQSSYDIKELISLGKDKNLTLREFDDDVENENSLFRQMENNCPGDVVDTIDQIVSFSRQGFLRHA